MKRFVSGLLRLFGLVPAGRYEILKRDVERLKAASLEWKRRADEALQQVRSRQNELREQAQTVRHLRASIAKLEQRRDEIAVLRAELAEAEQQLAVARDHLMAIEVQLDILEGAANVLDLRTRKALSSEPSGSRAPV